MRTNIFDRGSMGRRGTTKWIWSYATFRFGLLRLSVKPDEESLFHDIMRPMCVRKNFVAADLPMSCGKG